jgi:hypothetical protein
MNPIHSLPLHFLLPFNICLGLPSDLFPSGFITKFFLRIYHLPHARYIPRLYHPCWFNHLNNIWWSKTYGVSPCAFFLHRPFSSRLLGPYILLSALFSKCVILCSSLHVTDQVNDWEIRKRLGLNADLPVLRHGVGTENFRPSWARLQTAWRVLHEESRLHINLVPWAIIILWKVRLNGKYQRRST